jgi:transcriptional regulator with XRE-family HTH domain
MDQIGRLLTHLRKELGYSQTDLARKIGISRQAVDQWERGKTLPSLQHLAEIARIMGVSAAFFLNGTSAETSIDAELQGVDEPLRSTLRDSFAAAIKQFKARQIS